MNKPHRKIIYWGVVLSIYALMVVVFLRLLLTPELEQSSPLSADVAGITVEHESNQSLLDLVEQSGGVSGALLPLGPDEGHLPGNHALWHEFQRASQYDEINKDKDGFDGFQVVEELSELSVGALSEIFLSGAPRQVFQRGQFLYLLNDKQQLQVVDCKDPREPRLKGSLPYADVKHMELQGTIAYLLMERRVAPVGQMLVVDLKTPDKPRELARIELPEDAFSFFFVNSQLVVYASQRGSVGNNRVYLYDLDDRFQLSLRGSVESPNLGDHFLRYDDYILIPGWHEGLSIYDFSNPLDPELVAFVDSPEINRLARYGDIVFATGPGRRMYAFDFHDPLQPVLTAVVEEAHHPTYLLKHGNYSYFFTFNGYLRVFDLPLIGEGTLEGPATAVDGELIALSSGTGFTLLGKTPVFLPAGVTGVLPLPETMVIVDHLVWQDALVILDDEVLLHFYRVAEDSSPVFLQKLQLEKPQRWLAAGNGYLYSGGDGSVTIIAGNADDTVSVLKTIDLSGKETWDGLVLQKTLFIAAGKEGLLTYSLQRPDAPTTTSGWAAPRHLQPQVDVRHLAAVSDSRVLFTAGKAGLFSGHMDDDRKFRLGGSFRFHSPARAIAVHDGFALVATESDICVVDVRGAHSFQALGKIAFPRVKKLAVASPDLWAGYAAAAGWTLLPLPRFLLPGEISVQNEKSHSSLLAGEQYRYRLHLFNDRDVKTVSGLVTLPVHLTKQPNAGGPLVQ